MIIKNDKLLDTFRGPGFCELCKKPCPVRTPHHVYERGIGGARRLDVSLNLLALGPVYVCKCHDKYHSHDISRAKCLEAVARREGSTAEDVQMVLLWLINLPAMLTPLRLAEAMEKLTPEQQRLAEKALRDGGKE